MWAAIASFASTGSAQALGFQEVSEFQVFLPFIIGMVLVAGVSFVDDVISLPDSLPFENLRVNCGSTRQRLVSLSNQVVQFASYGLMFWSLGVFGLFGEYGWLIGIGCTLLALIVCVGERGIYRID